MSDNQTNPRQPVVKIVHPEDSTKWKIINAEDFDASQHELWDKAKEVLQTDPAAVPGAVAASRNPTGTYSEPTPTDVRFPNKDATEFENNHGAFIGRNAADLRAQGGMPDAPGGVAVAVEIPSDWEKLPAAEKAALAEKLGGDKGMSGSKAAEFIKTVAAERAASADPAVAAAAAEAAQQG